VNEEKENDDGVGCDGSIASASASALFGVCSFLLTLRCTRQINIHADFYFISCSFFALI